MHADIPGGSRSSIFTTLGRSEREDSSSLKNRTSFPSTRGSSSITATRSRSSTRTPSAGSRASCACSLFVIGRGWTETYAFTEIDGSVSGGLSFKGRAQDTFGIAFVRNRLSAEHRDYLAAGGLGFFIGDGRLNYLPETVVEAFYNLSVVKSARVSFDLQRIGNPAYNADRGPVTVVSARVHYEF